MDLTLITPPAAAPVSLAEAKVHLRVLNTAEDTLITALIEAAAAHLGGRDGILGRALVTQTWELRLASFGCAPDAGIDLPLPPLRSVVSVKYIDDAGVEQTVASGDYVVETGRRVGRVRPAYGKTWPAPRAEPGAVRIQFEAGYGAASAVPAPIRHAMLLLIGHWWVHKTPVMESGNMSAPYAVDALAMPYRVCPL